jgi:hypothetical protein
MSAARKAFPLRYIFRVAGEYARAMELDFLWDLFGEMLKGAGKELPTRALK